MNANRAITSCGEPAVYVTDAERLREGWIVQNAIVPIRDFPPIGSTVSVRDTRYRVIGVRHLMADETPLDCRHGLGFAVAELTLAPEA